jgi:hypothetical protein
MQSSPPANEAYMIAAYLVTAIIVLWYATVLLGKARKALRDDDRR